MKAYYRNIGDWDVATAGLSDAQYTVYDRLVSYYYATEHPLPAHADALRDIARATTPERITAVESVLKRFFTLHEGHYHSQKCDEEIAKFRQLIEKRTRAGRVGAMTTNRKRAESKPASADHLPAAQGSANEQQSSTSTSREATTKPLPTSSAAHGAASAETPKDKKPEAIARRVIDHLNAKGGFGYQYAKAHVTLILQRIGLDRASEEQLCAVIDAKVAEWGNDAEKRRYLSPDTLFNATKYAKYAGQLSSAAPGLPPAPKQYMIEYIVDDGAGRSKCVVTSYVTPTGDVAKFPFIDAGKNCLREYGGAIMRGTFVRDAKNLTVKIGEHSRVFSLKELME